MGRKGLQTEGKELRLKKELPKNLPTRVLEKTSHRVKLFVERDLKKLERVKGIVTLVIMTNVDS